METNNTQLGMEDLQLLSAQDKQNYMDLTRLFEHPGWKLVMKWADDCFEESKSRVLSASSWDVVNTERGAGRAFSSVLNIENATELDYRILADEAKYAAAQEPGFSDEHE